MAFRTFIQRDNDSQRLQDELRNHLNKEEDKRCTKGMEEDGFIAPESDTDSNKE